MRENNCLLIERGEICCGPMTAAGCNARCPELRVPCVGCRGPVRDSNAPSLQDHVRRKRASTGRRMAARLRTFAPLGGC